MTSDRIGDIYTGEAAGAAVRARYEEQLAAWPVPAERHELHTRAGRTFVLTCGPDDGPPVVLLPGAGHALPGQLPRVAEFLRGPLPPPGRGAC